MEGWTVQWEGTHGGMNYTVEKNRWKDGVYNRRRHREGGRNCTVEKDTRRDGVYNGRRQMEGGTVQWKTQGRMDCTVEEDIGRDGLYSGKRHAEDCKYMSIHSIHHEANFPRLLCFQYGDTRRDECSMEGDKRRDELYSERGHMER